MTKVYKVGEKILTERSRDVQPKQFTTRQLGKVIHELNTIAREMGAVGFSAPQIGHATRVMMIGMEFDNPRRPNVQQFKNMTFVNPEILSYSEEKDEDWEGCASFDTQIALVERPITIQYRAQNEKGETITGTLKNFAARVFQHELDHLDGVLMDKRAKETRQFDVKREKIISLKS